MLITPTGSSSRRSSRTETTRPCGPGRPTRICSKPSTSALPRSTLSHAAARDLDNIMQKKRPFQDFLAEFDLLALKCDKSDREKVALLRKKVSSEIAALTTSMVDPPKLDDYDEWCRILGIFANNIADAEHRQKSNQNQSQSNHQNQTQNNNSSGEPMDLDAIYA